MIGIVKIWMISYFLPSYAILYKTRILVRKESISVSGLVAGEHAQ